MSYGELGRFPFDKKIPKILVRGKWKTFFFGLLDRKIPGKFPEKWKCSKGNPIFPVGTSRLVSRVPIAIYRYFFTSPGRVQSNYQLYFVNKMAAGIMMYQCSCCFLTTPSMEHLLNHDCSYKNSR